jgi:hypothetical protein
MLRCTVNIDAGEKPMLRHIWAVDNQSSELEALTRTVHYNLFETIDLKCSKSITIDQYRILLENWLCRCQSGDDIWINLVELDRSKLPPVLGTYLLGKICNGTVIVHSFGYNLYKGQQVFWTETPSFDVLNTSTEEFHRVIGQILESTENPYDRRREANLFPSFAFLYS